MATKKSTKNKAAVKTRNAGRNRKSKSRARQNTSPVTHMLAVSGVYPGVEQARAAYEGLVQTGFPDSAIFASAMNPEPQLEERDETVVREETRFGASTARVVGSMLALGSAPLLAPLMVVGGPLLATVFGMNGGARHREHGNNENAPPVLLVVDCAGGRSANRAKNILEDSGATNITAGELRECTDLENREYRDESGNLHHHTRAYMREYAA